MDIYKIKFTGNEFYITEQSIGNVHVRIIRYVRTTTIEGMKQPIKVGVSMGVDTRLELKKDGKPIKNGEWKLTLNKNLVQYGVADTDGINDGLNISTSNSDQYELLICDKNGSEILL